MIKFVDKNQTDLKEKAVRNIAMTISIKKIMFTCFSKLIVVHTVIKVKHTIKLMFVTNNVI